jgi:hypothetical protein
MQAMPPVLQVRPTRASGTRDLPALETALAGLALDERSPIALELAATTTTRQFLLRAEQMVALRHLERQVQARYPQASISPVATDPLALAPGEACSVIELRPGAASYLPLRSWKAREIITEGTDPLLGILAAFSSLPDGARAVAQLACVPASPTWSASSRRYAVEHPLQKEHAQARGGTQERSIKDVFLLFPVVLVLLLVYAFHGVIPSWLLQAVLGLVRGQTPHLTTTETMAVFLGGGAALLILFGGAYLAMVLLGRFGAPQIYDQRLVEEKTARPAYRVRLRLFVFAADAHPGKAPAQRGRRALQIRQILHIWDERGRKSIQPPDLRETWLHLRTHWRAQRRLVAAGRARQNEREDVLRTLVAAYRQYHLAAGGYFLPRTLSRRHMRKLLAPPSRGWLTRVGWASDLTRAAHYLSVADLAALWHLPQAEDLPDLVYVERSTMRTLLAPSVLATSQGYRIGTSTHAGQTLPVYLPFACLLQNLLAAAATGKGKSNLFYHLARAFALGRRLKRSDVPDGALVIDPHGDLADRVAGALPPELIDDVIWLNLAGRDYPLAFNPLDMSGEGKDRDKIIDNLIQVIEALWPTSYGPRTESFLEYSCKTLAEANAALIADNPLTGPDRQYTLLDVVPLLRRSSFRHAVLEYVHDPHLLTWWHQYYELLDARQQADFTSSLITKVSKFSSSRIISRILGQPRSTLDLSEIIRQDKIVLFSCASGEIGADMAALFGSLFAGFFQAALQEQARLHPTKRHRFLVLIDEFQALAGINYQSMLAELRKYGGSFGLATQSLAYLDRFDRTLRATVLANTEHIFAFAMADEDARLLRLPGVEPEDVTQLPNYTCYTRLSLNGERLPVFSLLLDAPEEDNEAQRLRIAHQCRTRYGRPVGDVDRILRECQTRQEMNGTALPWEALGVETVAETMERIKKRKRGSGVTKKAGKDTSAEEAPPQHVMYDEADELPLWGPDETGKGEA